MLTADWRILFRSRQGKYITWVFFVVQCFTQNYQRGRINLSTFGGLVWLGLVLFCFCLFVVGFLCLVGLLCFVFLNFEIWIGIVLLCTCLNITVSFSLCCSETVRNVNRIDFKKKIYTEITLQTWNSVPFQQCCLKWMEKDGKGHNKKQNLRWFKWEVLTIGNMHFFIYGKLQIL